MLRKNTGLKKLIENQTAFIGPESELSIYDTYQQIEKVPFKADELLFCGMISGKKLIHHNQLKLNSVPQVFIPHESFIIAPQQNIEIDFPDADLQSPTSCLTIEISREKVNRIAEQLNHHQLSSDNCYNWQQQKTLHLHHTTATQKLLERLAKVFSENHQDRSFLIDLGVSELVMRLLRHQHADFLLSHSQQQPDHNGLNAAIDYIENHIEKPIDIDQLGKISCMSRSNLFKVFREKLQMTPCEFQRLIRLNKAKQLLNKGTRVTDVCFRLGFNNPSHFSRLFKGFFGLSPKAFQQNTLHS
ncbi:helix-turn-helix domain-containing protein [Pelagibaculum spongiae]|uniref:AraC family transcriptional regulator n=1 Tax=Pelagibaculum spongiae TaxID=2080658 RepID=A0A2V1H246_9GAMM|nr:helix-turn-helix domain-containing protein [Pelagibaculum spongiae]PVZ68976.1 AraC family transcriptional regulator [Pelagibaculum spongiae]